MDKSNSMTRCRKCGEELKMDALFCPNCGFQVAKDDSEVTYGELIMDIIYVDNRLSKAKLAGVAMFLISVFGNMIFILPGMLRINFLLFLSSLIVSFIVGLFYYAVCCGIGFVVRKFIN